jgi:hypothetical protein
MKISIAISSYKTFYEKSLKELIPSLIVSGVPKEDIFVFIGGYESYEILDNEYGVVMYKVPHNSFDFTALVSVVELSLDRDYWFSIHDTCKVGPTFYSRLIKLSKPNPTTKFTELGRSMNMGIYSNEFLNKIKNKLIKYKNTSDDLLVFKKKLVKEEDIFLKGSKGLCKTPREIKNPADYYSNGIIRIVEYFPDLDFYKIKSNWKSKDKYEINI